MPLLEQRRRPPAAPSLRARRALPRLTALSRRSWPLVWAVLHLAGHALGEDAGPRRPPGPLASVPGGPDTLARVGALLPAALVLPGAAVPVWVAVAACAWGEGLLERAGREARVHAAAPDPWAPAEAREWHGPLLLRTTGWSTPLTDGRWRVPGRLVRIGPGEGVARPRAGMGVLVTGRGPDPGAGSLVAARAVLRVPAGAGIPGGFDQKRYLAGRGLRYTGRLEGEARVLHRLRGAGALEGMRGRILAGLDAVLPPGEAGLAGSVLLGARDAEHRSRAAPFTALGLAHLFAVSGLHVGILLGLFALPARLAGAGPAGRFAPLLFILPVYAVLTGLPGSVVRAVGLGLLALAAPVAGGRAGPLRTLGLLFWAGCVWQPAQILDTGLRLSYLAAGGILAASAATDGFRFGERPWLRWPVAGLAVSVAAQWFTLPVVAGSFGRISLLSPLANLAAVPVFGLAVWLTAGALALTAAWPDGGAAVGAWSWLLLRGLAGGVALLARHGDGWPLGLPPPAAGTTVAWTGLTAAGLALLGLRRRAGSSRALGAGLVLVVVLGAWLFGPAARSLGRDRTTLWTFDVDQGDAALLQLPDGWTVLVDLGGVMGPPGAGGPSFFERSVRPWLLREGLGRVDAVVLTHGHLDHTGGARSLAGGPAVARWYCGGRSHRAVPDSLAAVVRPPPGRHLLHRAGDWRVEILTPEPPPGDHPDENDFSLVTVVRHANRVVAVLSGDLEKGGERGLLERGLVPRETEVWKAGHHGSATSGSAPFLERLDPAIVVVSCGVGNRYGHPSHGPYVAGGDTLRPWRTDLFGSVRFTWSAGGELEAVGSVSGRVP